MLPFSSKFVENYSILSFTLVKEQNFQYEHITSGVRQYQPVCLENSSQFSIAKFSTINYFIFDYERSIIAIIAK